MTNFKDELNRLDKEGNRKQRLLDIAFILVLTALISGMYFLITLE